MVTILARLFEHHRWANLRLVDACRDLTDAQLDATVAGTYGSIRDTLMHVAGAEQRYLHRLVDRTPTFHERDGWPGIDVLKDALDVTGQICIAFADAEQEDALLETVYQGKPVTLQRSTILVQAITHATEHRSQIATILTHQGIEPPDVSSWTWGIDATGGGQ
jgi:uncharacterized damage-inducible protein DinB